MKKCLLILLVTSHITVFGQNLDAIDAIVKEEMTAKKTVGLSVAVIKSGELVHLKAYGLRDKENNLEATINTPFTIASVSKTVVSAAIFKLMELKQIRLTDDINDYLPFQVINPHFPNSKISISQLLNHHSGINDGDAMQFWTYEGDSKIQLSEFLKDFLSVKGKLYHKSRFVKDTISYRYSNIGYGLLGYIAENVSKTSFEEFCRKYIFNPLEMNNTSWFLNNLDKSLVAKPYASTKSNGQEFKGFMGYPYYPCGQLRTSISDFSSFILGYINSQNGKFILDSITTETITPNPSDKRLKHYTWRVDSTFSKNTYYLHSGGEPGVVTWTLMDVTKQNAIIIFANSDGGLNNMLIRIDKELFN